MTDHDMPSGGGSYIRQKDGSLTLQEPPTALEATVEEPVQTPVEGLLKDVGKSPAKPVKEV